VPSPRRAIRRRSNCERRGQPCRHGCPVALSRARDTNDCREARQVGLAAMGRPHRKTATVWERISSAFSSPEKADDRAIAHVRGHCHFPSVGLQDQGPLGASQSNVCSALSPAVASVESRAGECPHLADLSRTADDLGRPEADCCDKGKRALAATPIARARSGELADRVTDRFVGLIRTSSG